MSSLLPRVVVPGHGSRVQHLRHLHEAAQVQALAPRGRHALAGDGRVADVSCLICYVLNESGEKKHILSFECQPITTYFYTRKCQVPNILFNAK